VRLSAVHLHRVSAVFGLLIVTGGAGACSSSSHSLPPPATTTTLSAPAESSTAPRPTVASAATTTTTSLPRPAPVALSATFISSRTGWALRGDAARCPSPDPCRYTIAKTIDAGLSWSAVASLPVQLQEDRRIRFANDRIGFVSDDEKIWQTHDGGAHWARLKLPFAGVQALEIASNTVYVVGGSRTNADPGFGYHIWSTPADRIDWAMDPLPVPVGAGPVPRQTLVLTHGAGWMVNLDRTVIGGARLESGHWTSWTPPCASLLGPVQLTASSATDLAASCAEHLYDGTPTNAVYFSHDGGATFARRSAPASGYISSPNATTAVVASGADAWRTADEGRSWHQVESGNESEGDTVLDLGFTTSTQGFLIEGAGGMLITRDAGATWRRVRLP
jgi:photosystem II stability/assembly factor-like uncharacterized protein